MKRYLLFNSSCSLCTQLALDIEVESDGWLEAQSLHNPEMQILVQRVQPDWQRQPTLVEVEDENVRVATGVTLMAKIVKGLGLRRAKRIVKLIYEVDSATKGVNQERRQFLRHGGALLVTLPLLRMPSLRNNLSLSDFDSLDWQVYKDADFGFTLQYPIGWQVKTKEEQPKILVDDEAILKRVVFSSSPALVYLDIWLAKGKNLSDWLTWYKETRQVEQMPTKANATVGTKSAATFLQEHQRDLMVTYFTDGEYVYRLLNWMTSNPANLDVYWHMLDTFILSTSTNSVKAILPLTARQNAIKQETMEANCCGFHDSGNPFPCCTDGNCTWWVYNKMGWVPFTGNANTWWGQVPNYAGWARSGSPPMNQSSIGWHNRGTFGHVAHIANYSGSSQVNITDMTCNDAWSCVRTTSKSLSYFGGYIYPLWL